MVLGIEKLDISYIESIPREFTDVSRFNVTIDPQSQFILKDVPTWFYPSTIMKRDLYGCPRCGIWVGIMLNGIPRAVRTEDAIATVERSIEEDPNESIRHRAQELDLCPSTLWKILRKDLAHFWLNDYVNIQICRILSEANPQVYVETSLHPKKLTIWCILWAGGIIRPYFFKNDEGHNVTVNGDRFRAMTTNFFIPELNNHGVQELWFQQDGATCHTVRATIDVLKDTFGDRLISRFGPVNWPPRSCDLTPLDYFLWGYVKSLFYADKPKRLAIWKITFAMLLPIHGHKCWKKSSTIGVQIGLHPSHPWQSYARNHI
ncbi:DUF4817 domain-containing protein [Trichonephila clavipes]|uniref:DUF4817 domain-containing protein n=1 Tax=Trichonephila clavipes TaxID=2585209 RepID=A0A8X6SAZ6_TRICX|nr:DUF4817 domain-containing protein [Trichonephila clavipes]